MLLNDKVFNKLQKECPESWFLKLVKALKRHKMVSNGPKTTLFGYIIKYSYIGPLIYLVSLGSSGLMCFRTIAGGG